MLRDIVNAAGVVADHSKNPTMGVISEPLYS